MSTKPTGRAPQILRFTTHGLSPKNRVQLWEGHNSRALIPLDIRTIEDSPLRAQQTNLNLPSIRMADVFGTSQIVERSETFINDHPTGVVAVFFATEGEAFFFHRGGHISLGPGQAIVYDADRPFVRGFSRGFRELVLTIPRQLYEDLLGPGGPDLPAVFDFGPGAGASEQALARRLQHALAVASAPGLETDPTARHSARMELAQAEEDTLGLLQLILASPGSSPTGVVAAATDFIERHLTDPDLPPSRVAEAAGVSERHLGRLFADSGTTVSRVIQARRLELAREFLASPDHGRLPVAEVAAHCGFTSHSHFGRVFRERFGLTPLQWRKESQRGHLDL